MSNLLKLLDIVLELEKSAEGTSFPFCNFVWDAYSSDKSMAEISLHKAAAKAFSSHDGADYYHEDDGEIGVTITEDGCILHNFADELRLSIDDLQCFGENVLIKVLERYEKRM